MPAPNIQTMFRRDIVLRRATSRGNNEINLKLLAAHNYWLSLPVTDDDAANARDLFARRSSLVVIDSGAISARIGGCVDSAQPSSSNLASSPGAWKPRRDARAASSSRMLRRAINGGSSASGWGGGRTAGTARTSELGRISRAGDRTRALDPRSGGGDGSLTLPEKDTPKNNDLDPRSRAAIVPAARAAHPADSRFRDGTRRFPRTCVQPRVISVRTIRVKGESRSGRPISVSRTDVVGNSALDIVSRYALFLAKTKRMLLSLIGRTKIELHPPLLFVSLSLSLFEAWSGCTAIVMWTLRGATNFLEKWKYRKWNLVYET